MINKREAADLRPLLYLINVTSCDRLRPALRPDYDRTYKYTDSHTDEYTHQHTDTHTQYWRIHPGLLEKSPSGLR